MAHNSLYPAFIQVEYSTAYGIHTMRLATREWLGGVSEFNELGDFLNWAEAPVSGMTALEDLLVALRASCPTTTTFTHARVYTMTDPDALPIPRVATALALDGTNASPGWNKAVQWSASFHDTEFNKAKIVLLDAATGNQFDKITDGSLSTLPDIITAFTAETAFWSSRAGFRPATFIQNTKTLNDKLRRSYRMN